MKRTIFARFEDDVHAARTLSKLAADQRLAHRFSVKGHEAPLAQTDRAAESTRSRALSKRGALVGAVAGALFGALFADGQLLGPFGPMPAALGGAIVGALVAGLCGYLVGGTMRDPGFERLERTRLPHQVIVSLEANDLRARDRIEHALDRSRADWERALTI